ncbi:MAG: glycosyltransferase family 2 protein [Lachnospiraceae bacterium]|nr:glycosyltransferase family 2 protein [Lachnospiraceae bacterium]
MIRTTVIIPNYNGIDYLIPCLDSLEQSSDAFNRLKVIVIDNGSDDGSAELVKERKTHLDLRLIELDKNTGFAYAVNRGIEAADTEFVLLLNNDITIDKDFVLNLEKVIESDERIFSVNSKMCQMKEPELLDGTGDHYCALGWAYAAYKNRKTDSYAKKDCSIFSACGGASIYRRRIFDEIGLFDEEHFAYLEDVDIGYRALIGGYKNMYCASAVCYHAGSGFSGSRYNEFKIKLASRNSIYIIYKNMPLIQLIINLPFLVTGFLIKIVFFILKGFGSTYLTGLIEGFKLSFSKKAREHKVRFKLYNIANYIKIQILLWVNIIRRLFV